MLAWSFVVYRCWFRAYVFSRRNQKDSSGVFLSVVLGSLSVFKRLLAYGSCPKRLWQSFLWLFLCRLSLLGWPLAWDWPFPMLFCVLYRAFWLVVWLFRFLIEKAFPQNSLRQVFLGTVPWAFWGQSFQRISKPSCRTCIHWYSLGFCGR